MTEKLKKTEESPLERNSASGLTKSQHAAILSRQQRIGVAACAGSGKTTVLVERYVQLVMTKGISLEKILAITYTEKAAHNMRFRLMKRFHEMKAPISVRQLEGAKIGTIHGFCRELLATYPFEAGLTPDFRILDDGQARVLKAQAMDLSVTAKFDEPMQQFLARYDLDEIRNSVAAVFDQARSRGINLPRIPDDPRPAYEMMYGEITRALRQILNESLERDRGRKGVRKDRLKKMSEALNWLETYGDLASLIRALPESDGIGGMLSFLRMTQESLTGKSPKTHEAKRMKNYYQAMMGLLVSSEGSTFSKSLFLTLLMSFASHYRRLKEDRESLDFDDLILHASALLQSQEARTNGLVDQIAGRFEHVLVDEYQDTNEAQAAIIDVVSSRAGLFFVGDVRQSIYGFRGADITVMQAKMASLQEKGGGEVIWLDDNYRSSPGVIDFINHFFSSPTIQAIDPVPGSELFRRGMQVGFSGMIAATKREQDEARSAAVLMVTRRDRQLESGDEARKREAKRIAGQIFAWQADQKQVREGNRGFRPLTYGDVTILLRTLGASSYYEEALRVQGIPSRVINAGGFYQRQEVSDLVVLLHLLERPFDDILLSAALRSPVFGMSNDGLLSLARHRKSQGPSMNLFAALATWAPEDPLFFEDRRVVASFSRLMSQWRRKKSRCKPSEILEGLMAATDYRLKILLQEDSDRAWANVEKFLEIARRFERNPNVSLLEFVRYVETMIEQEVREAEEFTGESEEAVKIMTVHQAKGLEFPVVILADMGSRVKQGSRSRFNLSFSPELGMKAWLPDLKEYVSDFEYVRNSIWTRLGEEEESLRLLYVAMTRARDVVVFSGVWVPGKAKPQIRESRGSMTWLELLLDYAGVMPEAEAGSWEVFDGKMKIMMDQDFPQPQEIRIEATSPREQFLQNIKVAMESRGRQPALLPEDQILYENFMTKDPTPAFFRAREITVTQWVNFYLCPKRYLFSHEVKIPHFLLPNQGEGNSNAKGMKPGFVSSDVVGDIFHRFAAGIDFNKIEEQVEIKLSQPEMAFLGENERQTLVKSLQGLLAKPFLDMVQKKQAYRQEIPFLFRLSGWRIRGQIDLLVQTGNSMVVLDYKTGAVPDNSEQGQGSAELQIFMYGLLCSKLFPDMKIELVLYYPAVQVMKQWTPSPDELSAFEKRVHENLRYLERFTFAQLDTGLCSSCPTPQACSSMAWEFIKPKGSSNE